MLWWSWYAIVFYSSSGSGQGFSISFLKSLNGETLGFKLCRRSCYYFVKRLLLFKLFILCSRFSLIDVGELKLFLLANKIFWLEANLDIFNSVCPYLVFLDLFEFIFDLFLFFVSSEFSSTLVRSENISGKASDFLFMLKLQEFSLENLSTTTEVLFCKLQY